MHSKKFASFFVKNATPDFLFIRPSGNTLDTEEFKQMISSDIVQEKAEMTKIHRFELCKWKYNNVHFYTRFKIYLQRDA